MGERHFNWGKLGTQYLSKQQKTVVINLFLHLYKNYCCFGFSVKISEGEKRRNKKKKGKEKYIDIYKLIYFDDKSVF